MASHSPHLWHLEVEKRARDQIRDLPSKDRRAVFQGIRELLIAENPQRVNDVRKLVEKRFEGLWRKREGDWRIFFALEPGEITVDKFTYRGKVIIVEVLNRKEAY
ncbi:MAG: hypothetical protein GC204_21425 [Chloroflexi bacterium]|nr:hypothetical protein [Chloroflexota bacterium]